MPNHSSLFICGILYVPVNVDARGGSALVPPAKNELTSHTAGVIDRPALVRGLIIGELPGTMREIFKRHPEQIIVFHSIYTQVRVRASVLDLLYNRML